MKVLGLVVGLLLVGAAALAAIIVLLPSGPSPPPQRIEAAAARLQRTCARTGAPPTAQQEEALRADAQTLARELRDHPDRTYQYPDDFEYSLRSVLEDTAQLIDRNSECRRLARSLRQATKSP